MCYSAGNPSTQDESKEGDDKERGGHDGGTCLSENAFFFVALLLLCCKACSGVEPLNDSAFGTASCGLDGVLQLNLGRLVINMVCRPT